MSEFAIVNNMIVPMKDRADIGSNTTNELLLGMVVEVLWEDRDGFVFVKTNCEYKGYCLKSELIFDEKLVEHWMSNNNIIVMGAYVDVTDRTNYI